VNSIHEVSEYDAKTLQLVKRFLVRSSFYKIFPYGCCLYSSKSNLYSVYSEADAKPSSKVFDFADASGPKGVNVNQALDLKYYSVYPDRVILRSADGVIIGVTLDNSSLASHHHLKTVYFFASADSESSKIIETAYFLDQKVSRDSIRGVEIEY